ncbi:outer membrane protein assembly factor BamA [soil metagenome]
MRGLRKAVILHFVGHHGANLRSRKSGLGKQATGHSNHMNSFAFLARRLALALAVAFAVPVAAGAASIALSRSAEAAAISSISIVGNKRVEPATIKSYLKIQPGKSYGASDIDSSVKALYATGLFSDVTVVARGSVLVVTVAENPVIGSVTFEGAKKVKPETLVDVVELKTRGVFTDAKLKADVFHIKQYYQTSGRSAAGVDARVTRLADNRVDVIYVINEGERTGVSTITFVGNKAFPSSTLSSVVSTRTTNWLSWFSKQDIYSEEKLKSDEELLRRYYLKRGYADFQVLSSQATYDAEKGRYYVTFTVDEGPKYTFGKVSIDSSIAGLNTEALVQKLKARSGAVFDASKIEKSSEDLTIELSRMGYVFAQVRPRGDRNYATTTIDLTFVVDEGARAYIERIDIVGNTRTRDYVIRREFDISEGDAFNRVLISKAERRLRDLGYFKRVDITSEPGSAPDKVIVLVSVTDQSTGSFSIAGGVQTSSSSTGLVAEVAMSETNFLGRGQTVRVSVGGGFSDQTFNASFSDPYFLGNRMIFGVDAYRVKSDAGSARPFATDTYGGGIRLGLPLSDELSAGVNYKINSQNISGAAAPAITYFPNGTRVTSSVGYDLVYSALDSKLDPREGVYGRFSQDFAGVGGDAYYVRTQGEIRAYKPVIPDTDLIGMVKVGAGNITGLGQPVASIDNFFKGGETIRGFAPMGYGPRDTTVGGGFAVGGKNYVNATAEVQFPLPMIPPDFGLRGAFFADAGMLFGNDVPTGGAVTSDAGIRTSVGGSIIWASPFGPIRADFAQALTYQSYDQLQVFRLGAGTQF